MNKRSQKMIQFLLVGQKQKIRFRWQMQQSRHCMCAKHRQTGFTMVLPIKKYTGLIVQIKVK